MSPIEKNLFLTNQTRENNSLTIWNYLKWEDKTVSCQAE